MAFASRQARGRRRWESSSAANSSSSRGLTIRCRTMTAIHRSGRCDKRDMKSRRGCRMEPFRSLPLREHRRGQGSRRKPLRGEGESANEPQCRQTFVLQHRIVTLIARNRRFTVDLSGARPRRLKSEFLSIVEFLFLRRCFFCKKSRSIIELLAENASNQKFQAIAQQNSHMSKMGLLSIFLEVCPSSMTENLP